VANAHSALAKRHGWRFADQRLATTCCRRFGECCVHVFVTFGVSIRTVSKYMGQADSGLPPRTYTHVMPSSDGRARQAIDAIFSVEAGAHLAHERTPTDG